MRAHRPLLRTGRAEPHPQQAPWREAAKKAAVAPPESQELAVGPWVASTRGLGPTPETQTLSQEPSRPMLPPPRVLRSGRSLGRSACPRRAVVSAPALSASVRSCYPWRGSSAWEQNPQAGTGLPARRTAWNGSEVQAARNPPGPRGVDGTPSRRSPGQQSDTVPSGCTVARVQAASSGRYPSARNRFASADQGRCGARRG